MRGGRPLEGGNQMQNTQESFSEDRPQVGEWVSSAAYDAAALKVSPSPRPCARSSPCSSLTRSSPRAHAADTVKHLDPVQPAAMGSGS